MQEFYKINTPEELLEYLKTRITYGVIDKDGKKYYDSDSQAFQNACNNWTLRSTQQILEDGVGHCYDLTEVERDWFEKNQFKFITNWVCAYEIGGDGGSAHSYLIYQDKENGDWVHFEVSDYYYRGLHRYKTLEDAIVGQTEHQKQTANIYNKPIENFKIEVYEFNKPKDNSTYNEYLDNARQNKFMVV